MRTQEERIEIVEEPDVVLAVLKTRSLAAVAGFGRADQFVVATAASELATNIVRYAGSGQLAVRIIDGGIEIVATDSGPGITDVGQAMQDHFSTRHRSMGAGLPGVKRMMDEFEIESTPGEGTRIAARKRV